MTGEPDRESRGLRIGNCTPVFLFGTPRGGTNLFSALLHNHDCILSLSNRAAKTCLERVDGEGTVLPTSVPREDLIYESGGLLKKGQDISHVLLDKVHWDKKRRFHYVRVASDLIQDGRARGIVLIRHPLGTLSSMHRFAERYGRPGWRATKLNVVRYLERFFLPQILLLREGLHKAVVIETFLEDLPGSYRDLTDWLGLPFKERFATFEASFEAGRAWSGSPFGVEERRIVAGGGFFQERGQELPAQKMWVDPDTGEATMGFGGLNPIRPIEPGRMVESWDGLSEDRLHLVRSIFERALSGEDVDYLFSTSRLDPDRLREMEVRDISGFAWRASLVPRLKRGVARVRRWIGSGPAMRGS